MHIFAAMDKIDIINNILSDIGNFVLVIFGFTVTLFTVLYSFILGKREQLKEYSERIKKGEIDPLLHQRESFAKNIIVRLKGLNNHLICIISVSFLMYLFSIVIKYLVEESYLKKDLLIALGIISLLLVLYVAIMLFLTIKDYVKNTKI